MNALFSGGCSASAPGWRRGGRWSRRLGRSRLASRRELDSVEPQQAAGRRPELRRPPKRTDHARASRRGRLHASLARPPVSPSNSRRAALAPSNFRPWRSTARPYRTHALKINFERGRRHEARSSNDANGRPAMTVDRSGDSTADPAPSKRTRASALLQKVIRIFHAGSHPLLEMSRCASCKHGVDGGEQIRCDGSFEDKSIGSRFNRRQLRILFLVDAESDQLQLREMAADSANQPQAHRRVGARDQPPPERRGADARSRTAKLHPPPPQPPRTLSQAGRVRLPPSQDADLLKAHNLSLLQASLHFAFAARERPHFSNEPWTRNASA